MQTLYTTDWKKIETLVQLEPGTWVMTCSPAPATSTEPFSFFILIYSRSFFVAVFLFVCLFPHYCLESRSPPDSAAGNTVQGHPDTQV